MKRNVTYALLLGGLLLTSTTLTAQLRNVHPVTAEGEYQAPVWSPDGEKLLFTGHHNDALFVLDLKGNAVQKIKEGAGIGYLANWSKDGQSVIYRTQADGHSYSDLKVKSLDLVSKKERELTNIHPDDLKQARTTNGRAAPGVIVYINPETLKLEAKRGMNGKPWVITPEEGQYYHPIVSPDEQSVVVHEGAHLYVYPIDGSGKRKDLGVGLATSWKPDNSEVLTFEDHSSDGHHITDSELFLIDVRDQLKIQLTRSSDLIETWGDISPDGKKIAFSDEKSGRIFIADLD